MENTKTTYRFKLSEEIIEELSYFAKIHKFDDNKTYKDAWKLWSQQKEDEINREKLRLTNMGYMGDINHKLYISARYYYKNKTNTKKQPTKRRKYISCDQEVISLMDEFISKEKHKPAESYNIFMKTHSKQQAIISQIQDFRENHELSDEEINDKLKKTFKNRYFLYNK